MHAFHGVLIVLANCFAREVKYQAQYKLDIR